LEKDFQVSPFTQPDELARADVQLKIGGAAKAVIACREAVSCRQTSPQLAGLHTCGGRVIVWPGLQQNRVLRIERWALRSTLPCHVEPLHCVVRTSGLGLHGGGQADALRQIENSAEHSTMPAIAQRRAELEGCQIVEVIEWRVVKRRGRPGVGQCAAQNVAGVNAETITEAAPGRYIQRVVAGPAYRGLYLHPAQLWQPRRGKCCI